MKFNVEKDKKALLVMTINNKIYELNDKNTIYLEKTTALEKEYTITIKFKNLVFYNFSF